MKMENGEWKWTTDTSNLSILHYNKQNTLWRDQSAYNFNTTERRKKKDARRCNNLIRSIKSISSWKLDVLVLSTIWKDEMEWSNSMQMFTQINKMLLSVEYCGEWEFIYQIIRMNWCYAKCISNSRFNDAVHCTLYSVQPVDCVNAQALMIHLRQFLNLVSIF